MSRIGKNPITIPSGVTITSEKNQVTVKGPKGELHLAVHPRMKIEIADGVLQVTRKSESKTDRSLHGLSRTLIANMVEGVTKGYEKKLEIIGVGYRAAIQGSKLTLSLGFSHPVEFTAPNGVNISIDAEKKNLLTISGSDKQMIGEVAAKIRSFKKPEPYKGKGIRYLGEHIIRKAGKAAAKDK
jgi:large subunit ribosomal protein L6